MPLLLKAYLTISKYVYTPNPAVSLRNLAWSSTCMGAQGDESRMSVDSRSAALNSQTLGTAHTYIVRE